MQEKNDAASVPLQWLKKNAVVAHSISSFIALMSERLQSNTLYQHRQTKKARQVFTCRAFSICLGAPTEIRTPVAGVKILCPRPLDDGAIAIDGFI